MYILTLEMFILTLTMYILAPKMYILTPKMYLLAHEMDKSLPFEKEQPQSQFFFFSKSVLYINK